MFHISKNKTVFQFGIEVKIVTIFQKKRLQVTNI